ncbi:MAG TPA: hypothetical protein P5110_04875 [Candidatus Omnitrophota bacterium]|nr:hypothetical protein [Candidatus Omnitrophota bacterium]HRZ14827.1 hypothetical protein [Candidatus Omnitrophota bacterium]
MKTSAVKKISLVQVYADTFKAIFKRPKVLWPFVIFAGIELSTLMLIYAAPRVPFNKLLAPPIRAFWGERFLHYPANFLLMPTLNSIVRNFLSVFIASLLTGSAVYLIWALYKGKKPSFSAALKQAGRKYSAFLAVVLLTIFLFFVVLKIMDFLLVKFFVAGHTSLLKMGPRIWFGPLKVIMNIFAGMLIQGVLVYAIPILAIGNDHFFKAIGKSCALFGKHFFKTLTLLVLPFLAYIPIVVLQYNSASLVDRFFPELILGICIVGILISSLIVDLVVTLSTTFFYIRVKENA